MTGVISIMLSAPSRPAVTVVRPTPRDDRLQRADREVTRRRHRRPRDAHAASNVKWSPQVHLVNHAKRTSPGHGEFFDRTSIPAGRSAVGEIQVTSVVTFPRRDLEKMLPI